MKRITLIIPLLVCLSFGSVQAKKLGDFNNDGSLSIADAIGFIRILMGLDPQGDVGKDYNVSDISPNRDILGNAEFEADGEYPPPENLDNYRDGEIVVTLRFGEPLDVFEKDEVYGYMITVDANPVNYHFKFVPGGKYWLEAEFVMIDSCFYDKSEIIQHLDSVDTVVNLHPTFLGTNMGCFDLILTGVSDGEFVKVEDRMFVARKVYKRFYIDGTDSQDFKLEKKENINIAKPLKRKR